MAILLPAAIAGARHFRVVRHEHHEQPPRRARSAEPAHRAPGTYPDTDCYVPPNPRLREEKTGCGAWCC